VDITQLSSQFSRDEQLGYVLGNHPGATPEELQRFKAMLTENRPSFALSLEELTGYSGPLGPVHIRLVHNHLVWEPERRNSPLEQEFTDEKLRELVPVGFVEPGDHTAPYAANPVNAAKKNEAGAGKALLHRLPAHQPGPGP
jgi:hypothetical protein